ncbi:diiron oxygenase [Acidithiobacillus montserratensis]|uniref:Diiron oxygenase n=1 Tax=Acidithiobacillus montserratensis TaxID=2729135 RepID=A0ACD5HHJ4_9PROT|nr:diiron oxygenase [Acidithiobacillus montserratensis]MBN2680042.1 diiron oxygenase [Acidithiobacillaceae bacterium]MBU2749379.1 diiron oxygenase [Acidithiobacillus montserratensis]
MTFASNLPVQVRIQRHHDALVKRLSAHSSQYRDPVSTVPWESLSQEQAWLPETLVSLYGLPEYAQLSDAERIRLSQVEFVSFCELGLWLEALFIQRLSANSLQEMYRDPQGYHYQLHELREEVGHSLMFLELQQRSHLPFMTPLSERPPLARLFARYAPEGSAAFWATILIGEDVPDRMNRLIFSQKDLPSAVLAITHVHMREEARHMAFARTTIQMRSQSMNALKKKMISPVLREVFRQFLRTCFFPSEQVYAAAGLSQPRVWARRARQNPQRIALMQQCASPSRDFLRTQGFAL